MIGGRLDIAERAQAELAARRNRQRLELLTEASQVGVWFCDLPFERTRLGPSREGAFLAAA